MKVFNYVRALGSFLNGQQLIKLAANPTDRQNIRMLEAANLLINAAWQRRIETLQKLETRAEDPIVVDWDKEKADFFPKTEDGQILMPLQYIQDYLIKKVAAIQNNTSIHNKADVAELRSVLAEYGVTEQNEFENLKFDFISWTARDQQKPKLLIHTIDQAGEAVIIRLEAAVELCQKFLNAAAELKLRKGDMIRLRFDAVDPAIERNKRVGKKVADEGKYVNHNMVLNIGANRMHTGHPPKGTSFMQKPTIEYLEGLYRKVQNEMKAL